MSFWTPPSNQQINSSLNPYRCFTEQQLKQQHQQKMNQLAEARKQNADALKQFYTIIQDYRKWSEEQYGKKDQSVIRVIGDLMMIHDMVGRGEYDKAKKVFNRMDTADREKVPSRIYDLMYPMNEAKAMSAKDHYKKVMNKGKVPSIDSDRYPNREAQGLEGPFRSRKSGLIYYYDTKAGKYYNPANDMYLDVSDIMEDIQHGLKEAKIPAHIVGVLKSNIKHSAKTLALRIEDFKKGMVVDYPGTDHPNHKKDVKVLESIQQMLAKGNVKAARAAASKLDADVRNIVPEIVFDDVYKNAMFEDTQLDEIVDQKEPLAKADIAKLVSAMKKYWPKLKNHYENEEGGDPDSTKRILARQNKAMNDMIKAVRVGDWRTGYAAYRALESGAQQMVPYKTFAYLTNSTNEDVNEASISSSEYKTAETEIRDAVEYYAGQKNLDKSKVSKLNKTVDTFLKAVKKGDGSAAKTEYQGLPEEIKDAVPHAVFKKLINEAIMIEEGKGMGEEGMGAYSKATNYMVRKFESATSQAEQKKIQLGTLDVIEFFMKFRDRDISGMKKTFGKLDKGVQSIVKKSGMMNMKENKSVFSRRNLSLANHIKENYTWDAAAGEYVRVDGEDPLNIDGTTRNRPKKKKVNDPVQVDEAVDSVSARELEMYITNDSTIYRQRITPIIKNYARKMKNGSFDENKAVKGFLYAVGDGIKSYNKEYGAGSMVIDKATKEEVARQLLDAYREEIMDASS